MSLPTDARRQSVLAHYEALIKAIEEHPLWKPPAPNRTLYFVWDFLKRSQYMLSEFENIRAGKKLQHPEQFKPAPGKGDAAAIAVFEDVCGRSMMAKLLITDTTGKTSLMTMNSGPPVDFGADCRAKVEELKNVCFPE